MKENNPEPAPIREKRISRRQMITLFGFAAAGLVGLRFLRDDNTEGLVEPVDSPEANETAVAISTYLEEEIKKPHKIEFTEGKLTEKKPRYLNNIPLRNPLVFEVKPGDTNFEAEGLYLGYIGRPSDAVGTGDKEPGEMVKVQWFVAMFPYDKDNMVFEGDYNPQSSVIEIRGDDNIAKDAGGIKVARYLFYEQ